VNGLSAVRVENVNNVQGEFVLLAGFVRIISTNKSYKSYDYLMNLYHYYFCFRFGIRYLVFINSPNISCVESRTTRRKRFGFPVQS
jgi:hypothetical protein